MDQSFKCRVCLEEGEEMYYLYSQTVIEDIELDYATIMMLCASVQVDFEDSLPKRVCATCFENLKQAYLFKLLCEKSYQKLCEDTKCDLKILKEDCDNISSVNYDDNEQDNIEIKIELEDHSTQLDEHYEYVLPDNKIETKCNILKQYKCDLCKKVFKRTDYFKKHLKTHGVSPDMIPKYINNKTFNCNLCYKVFHTAPGLKYHIEHHKGTKNHKCPHKNCNWSFISKQGLSQHSKIHTSTKSYLCTICGKSYLTRDSLTHHIKFHSEERPHKCPSCEKAFFQVCHLKNHLHIHTGIKPHTCESCGRSYTTNAQLKKHFNKYCGLGKTPVFKFQKNEKIQKP